jgi:hypothetical protein
MSQSNDLKKQREKLTYIKDGTNSTELNMVVEFKVFQLPYFWDRLLILIDEIMSMNGSEREKRRMIKEVFVATGMYDVAELSEKNKYNFNADDLQMFQEQMRQNNPSFNSMMIILNVTKLTSLWREFEYNSSFVGRHRPVFEPWLENSKAVFSVEFTDTELFDFGFKQYWARKLASVNFFAITFDNVKYTRVEGVSCWLQVGEKFPDFKEYDSVSNLILQTKSERTGLDFFGVIPERVPQRLRMYVLVAQLCNLSFMKFHTPEYADNQYENVFKHYAIMHSEMSMVKPAKRIAEATE